MLSSFLEFLNLFFLLLLKNLVIREKTTTSLLVQCTFFSNWVAGLFFKLTSASFLQEGGCRTYKVFKPNSVPNSLEKIISQPNNQKTENNFFKEGG